jgi:hypothetical protein
MDRSRLKPRSSTWKAQNVKIVLQEIWTIVVVEWHPNKPVLGRIWP